MAETLDIVEQDIKAKCAKEGLRIEEFFLDYDPLRSGFVTRNQFFRVLHENLRAVFTPKQENALAYKYDINGDQRICYRFFVGEINKTFNARNMSSDPVLQTNKQIEHFGTEATIRPLSPCSEEKLEALLKRMIAYFKYHGLEIRSAYEDFDRHNIGKVTESQFYRNLPGPPDLTEEQIHLLVKKYRDPNDAGMVVYYNLFNDMLALDQRDTNVLTGFNKEKQGYELDKIHGITDPSVQDIINKMRVAVHKFGIRTPEFFRDYDSLRSGNVTEAQFNQALMLAVGKEAQLTPSESCKIAEYYRISEGVVKYRSLCDLLEHAFNTPQLEKLPTHVYTRPPAGALGRHYGELDSEEQLRLEQILCTVGTEVRKRRIEMYQYFKDFDRSNAYTRVMTQSQFSRVLHFLTLNVSQHDLDLICKAFKDPTSGDVNYPAFVQAVDELFTHTLPIGAPETFGEDNRRFDDPKVDHTVDSVDTSNVNLNDLLALIRHIALTNRLRIKEYFEDFDKLRSGLVTDQQFQRCLSSLGLSKLGYHDLTRAQCVALCNYYADPNNPTKIVWTKFMNDIESVFTQPNMEKDPNHRAPAQEIFHLPKPGTADWRFASADHVTLYETAMNRLRTLAEQRRILCLPIFEDFDKHNQGHIQRQRFRQAMTILNMSASEPELVAIEARYTNDVGFDYRKFLNDLQPPQAIEHMYPKRLATLREVNASKGLPEFRPKTNLEEILFKIKNKVVRERIRLNEFMRDYDKLNSKKILKNQFRRALNICQLELNESELSILEDRYQSLNDNDKVDYQRFCDEVESVFTIHHMEKTPTHDPVQYEPQEPWKLNILDNNEECLFEEAMSRIANKVRQHRMQLFPLFEDFDPVHSGHVSKTQFRRVLTELDLNSVITTQENDIISRKLEVRFGGRDDVNYNAFCDMIYDKAGIIKRVP